MAPNRMASLFLARSSVSPGSGSPVASMATCPMMPSSKLNSCLKFCATDSSTFCPQAVTSCPIPSPGMTSIFLLTPIFWMMCLSKVKFPAVFVLLNIIAQTQEVINIVVSVDQTGFFVRVNIKAFLFAGGYYPDHLGFQVYFQFCFSICFNSAEDLVEETFTYLHRQNEIIQCIVLEDIREKAAHYYFKSIVADRPGSMLAGGATAKVLTSYQHLSFI